MDPHFITSVSVSLKGITIHMIVALKAGTEIQTVISVLFHQLFGDPSCTHFVDMKSVMDDFISRTVTNLQLVRHFIISHPSVVEA